MESVFWNFLNQALTNNRIAAIKMMRKLFSWKKCME
jgi:hypothetical protein